MKTAFVLIGIALGCSALAQGRYETLMFRSHDGSQTTNTLEVSSEEVAELVSYDFGQTPGPRIDVVKDGKRITAWQFQYFAEGQNNPAQNRHRSKGNLFVKGPARVELWDSTEQGIFTFRIWPERADPNTTQFISPQDGDVTVKMESSTDLLQWSPATNGVYSVESGAKFFRLRLDKGQ